MRRTFAFAVVVTAVLVAAAPAFGQEIGAGNDRFEVAAVPIGGVFFGTSSDARQPDFGDYNVGVALTVKPLRRLAFEGEVGRAIGIRQDFAVDGRTFVNQKAPSMFAYGGNLVFTPTTNGRGFSPYAAGGVGGLVMLHSADVVNLGLTRNVNYLTGNIGGGLKWFAASRWGVRGDYRLMVVRDTTAAPAFFGRDELRWGHRVYGALLVTY
jgi:hypothetical protein